MSDKNCPIWILIISLVLMSVFVIAGCLPVNDVDEKVITQSNVDIHITSDLGKITKISNHNIFPVTVEIASHKIPFFSMRWRYETQEIIIAGPGQSIDTQIFLRSSTEHPVIIRMYGNGLYDSVKISSSK